MASEILVEMAGGSLILGFYEKAVKTAAIAEIKFKNQSEIFDGQSQED